MAHRLLAVCFSLEANVVVTRIEKLGRGGSDEPNSFSFSIFARARGLNTRQILREKGGLQAVYMAHLKAGSILALSLPLACVQPPPPLGKNRFECNKGNRRRLHAGYLPCVLSCSPRSTKTWPISKHLDLKPGLVCNP